MEGEPYEFDLERIKALIKERRAKRVGLQLPEGLKRIATDIALEISRDTGAEVLISGNSCYGACDLDERLEGIVDLLFHFGHSDAFSFKRRKTMKVIFVELRSTIDVKPVVERAVAEIKGDCVGLVTTVQHLHALNDAKTVLTRSGKSVVIGKSRLGCDGQILGCDFSSAMVPCDEILFIGSGSFHPSGLALYIGKRVIAADPFTMQIDVFKPETLRKKQYGVIARALDAKSFGIIIGMKSGQFNLTEAVALQRKAAERGLDAHLITMEEVNEERLLGFKVDAFVNTACPRLVEDFVHFNKPVLSINGFEVVLGERSWDDIWE
ncbi:MAG: diphthamide biosynthesis enzyme Dph2 [Candidatus Methanospirareceae archaeon]